MSLFARLEKRLGEMVEGLFSRAFKAPVHPIEIARRLAAEMDERKAPSVSRTYAPNEYAVFLHPDDAAMLEGFRDALLAELCGYLADHAREQGYTLLGAPTVVLEPRETVERGQSVIHSRLVPREQQPEDTRELAAASDTKVYRLSRLPALVLAVVSGPGAGSEYPVPAEGLSIGRRADNAVVLADPQVSRHHARIEPTEDRWDVVDLDSTNGTAVNGERITRRALAPGDHLTIGSTTLEVRAPD